MKTSLEELLEGMAADAAAIEPRKGSRPPPPPIPASALDSLDDGPVLVGPLRPAALPTQARRGPPPPPARRARGTEPAATDHSGLLDMKAMARTYQSEAVEREAIARAAEEQAIAPAAAAEVPAPEPVTESEPAPPPIVAEGTGRVEKIIDELVDDVEPVEDEDIEEAVETKAAPAPTRERRKAVAWPRVVGFAALIALLAGSATVTAMIVRSGSDDQTAVLLDNDEMAAVATPSRQIAPAPAVEAPPPAPAPEPAVALEVPVEVPALAISPESEGPVAAPSAEDPSADPAALDPQPAVASSLPADLFGEAEEGCFDPACAVTARAEEPAAAPKPIARKELEPAEAETSYYRHSVPTRPSSSEIASAIVSVQDVLDGCGDAFGTRGAVQLKVRIKPSGSIAAVAVKQGNASFRSCVSDAVLRVKLGESQLGASESFAVLVR